MVESQMEFPGFDPKTLNNGDPEDQDNQKDLNMPRENILKQEEKTYCQYCEDADPRCMYCKGAHYHDR